MRICLYRYFHRAPRRSADSHRSETSLTGYRGGTRKGLDLAFGSTEASIPLTTITTSPYFSPPTMKMTETATTTTASNVEPPSLRGGVLLRTIRRISDSKIISGPSLLVDQILLASQSPSISDLVSQKWADGAGHACCTSAFPSEHDLSMRTTLLFLQPRSSSSEESLTIYTSPRIGLDLSHPGTTPSLTHPRVAFLPRPYRYFVHPHLLTANGRTQTFLGILQACLLNSNSDETWLRSELIRITGLKKASVEKYLGEYRKGGKLGAFVGSAGKGASGSPATYLRMMGTLERMRIESGG